MKTKTTPKTFKANIMNKALKETIEQQVQIKQFKVYSKKRSPTNEDVFLNHIDEVLVALRRVIRATDLHSKHLSKTTGLTSPQILLLHTIREKGEVTIGEIAQDMSLSQATVTTIIDRLEKRKLVFRERSTADKRKVHAYLTDEGHEILKTAPVPLQDQFAKHFADLQEWEKTMIISSLQRVAHMMDAQHIDASPVLDIGTLDRQSTPVDLPDEFSKK